MKRNLLRFGLLCLMMVFAFIAKAQDVTAEWNFKANLPEGIQSIQVEKSVSAIASTVEGIEMTVDATNGKLKGRSADAQINKGTILKVPVKSSRDIVTIMNYGNEKYRATFTIGETTSADENIEHNATVDEATQGYVQIEVAENGYFYGIKLVQASALQEKTLYSTDFTNWNEIDRKKATNEVAKVKTLYSKEELSFTFNGVGVYPTGTNSKFPEITGFMQTAKYTGEYKAAEPSVVTSALASITKITLHQAATGGNRGIKVSAPTVRLSSRTLLSVRTLT